MGPTQRPEGEERPDVLRVAGLRKEFTRRGVIDSLRGRQGQRTVALNDVSLAVGEGETLGLVGESGSGKTTLARALVRLVEPDVGEIEFRGEDVLSAHRGALRELRRRMQLVYQDPYSSLNSAQRIGDAIIEPALVHGLVAKADASVRLEELMGQVGLDPDLADRRPAALSGGQRQRVAIARALAAEPEVLIADEAVSALDVSVQRQVLNLFSVLCRDLGLTLIFVSHQLATVAQLCERVAIMYKGTLVEIGPTREVFARPRHGYTAALIEANPGGRRLRDRPVAPTPLQDSAAETAGCPFHQRCAFARPICGEVAPSTVEIAPGHTADCHVLPDDQTLAEAAGIKDRAA